MLCLKMVVLHSSTAVTNDKFRFFGLFWFTLADFIPRGLPSLAFVALMMYSRRDTHSELNREFLRPGTELSNDALFIEYRNELDDSSNGPPAHFKFLSDGYSPRTAGHDYYDELSYDEEDNDMLLLDGIHLDALGYRSPISSYPTRGRLLSHTEV